MAAVAGKTFDSRDGLSRNHRNRQRARACRLSVDMDGARAAQRHAATELRTGQAERIAQDPEQRHLRYDIDTLSFAVQSELYWHRSLLTIGGVYCEKQTRD